LYDPRTLDLAYDLTLTPKPGTRLARDIAAINPATSLFAALPGNEPAAQALVRFTVPADFRPPLDRAEKALKESPPDLRPLSKTATAKVVTALLPTLRAGEADAAVVLRGPRDGRYTLVAGLRLSEAREVESAAREAVQGLPQEWRGLVKPDARA